MTALAAYVEGDPSTWDGKLPFMSFAYNPAQQASIKMSPFEAMFGRMPVIPEKADIVWTPKTRQGKNWANHYSGTSQI
jgi:hypothetical protein